MASQVFLNKPLRLSLVILLASFAVSVAAAVPDGAVRIVYALDTILAPQHQISSKRHLRSSTAMTSSDDTKTAERRLVGFDLAAKIDSGLSTVGEKSGLFSAGQSALVEFNKLGLNSATVDTHSNPRFLEWVAFVQNKYSKSPEKAAGVIFGILSKHFNRDPAKRLVPKELWQGLANSEFTRLKLNKVRSDKLLGNEDFIEWKAFVKVSNSPESAGRETFTTLTTHHGSNQGKAVFANILKQDVPSLDFDGLHRRGDLLQNSKFLDWIAYGKVSSLTDADDYLRKAISGHVSDDLVSLVVEQGLRQAQVNSEFIHQGLDKASGDLLENKSFLKWIDFIKDSSSPESAGRETFAAMKYYYGFDRAKVVFAEILQHDLPKIDFYKRDALLQNRDFINWIAYGKASSRKDIDRGVLTVLADPILPSWVDHLIEKGQQQASADSKFKGLGLVKDHTDLLKNEYFLKWIDFVKASSSPEIAGHVTFTTLKKNYDSGRAKAVFAAILKHDLPTQIDYIELFAKNDLHENREFLDWIAYGKAISLEDAVEYLPKAFSDHELKSVAVNLVMKGLQGQQQYRVDSEFTRLELDKASGDLLENEHFLKWIDFVKDSSSLEIAGRDTYTALEKYYGSDLAKAVFAAILKHDLPNINFMELYREAKLFQDKKFLDWIAYGKASTLENGVNGLREALADKVSSDYANLFVDSGLQYYKDNKVSHLGPDLT